MLADGMTKASVDREALITVCERGEWHLQGDEPVRAQKFHGGESVAHPNSVARSNVPPDAKAHRPGEGTSKPKPIGGGTGP